MDVNGICHNCTVQKDTLYNSLKIVKMLYKYIKKGWSLLEISTKLLAVCLKFALKLRGCLEVWLKFASKFGPTKTKYEQNCPRSLVEVWVEVCLAVSLKLQPNFNPCFSKIHVFHNFLNVFYICTCQWLINCTCHIHFLDLYIAHRSDVRCLFHLLRHANVTTLICQAHVHSSNSS